MDNAKNNCCLYHMDSGIELIFCKNSMISYPLHNHVSVFTLGMVLDGSIILNNNQSRRAYTKGQSFFIPPYAPHSIKANKSYTLISICIQKQLLCCSSKDLDKIKLNIIKMINEKVGRGKIKQAHIVRFLSCLKCFGHKDLTFAHENSDLIIHSLMHQLEQSPECKLSIDDMAQAAFISKYHFIRSFKQAVGLTPHQFQLQNRIRKAQRLINNAHTIAEVASTTGFCDQSHFIKQFEKRVGLSPIAYKRSCN